MAESSEHIWLVIFLLIDSEEKYCTTIIKDLYSLLDWNLNCVEIKQVFFF